MGEPALEGHRDPLEMAGVDWRRRPQEAADRSGEDCRVVRLAGGVDRHPAKLGRERRSAKPVALLPRQHLV